MQNQAFADDSIVQADAAVDAGVLAEDQVGFDEFTDDGLQGSVAFNQLDNRIVDADDNVLATNAGFRAGNSGFIG